MSINHTLNYLLARRSGHLLCFSEQVTTYSTYLKGAGGESGDGWPLPASARIYRIDCWDGTLLVSGTGNVNAGQGDRISLWAEAGSSVFKIFVRINGVNTSLNASGAAQNATLMVTVHLQLI